MDRRKARSSDGPSSSKARSGRSSLPFPMMQMPGMEMNDDGGSEEDIADEDLEAELNALMNGTAPARNTAPRANPHTQTSGPVPPPRRTESAAPNSRGMMEFDLSAIERMGQEEDDEDNEDVDEDDPELLAELQELSPEVTAAPTPTSPSKTHPSTGGSTDSAMLTMLQERLENYEGAHQDAVYEKESAKARRYERSIKTLKEQIVLWKKGQPVAEDDVPPPVFIKSVLQKTLSVETKASPNPVPPPLPTVIEPDKTLSSPSVGREVKQSADHELLSSSGTRRPAALDDSAPSASRTALFALKERREQYGKAALDAKREGNKAHALRYMTIYKEFQIVIKAAEEGQEVDLSQMPPPPDQLQDAKPEGHVAAEESVPNSPFSGQKAPSKPGPADQEEIPDIDPSEVKDTFKAPDAPKTVLEALQQRLAKYKSTLDEATAVGDSSKVRRMKRIVLQYEDSIRDYSAKRPVNFEELPTPPGFGPIPLGGAKPAVDPAAPRPGGGGGGPPVPRQSGSSPAASLGPVHSSRESRQAQQYHLLVERQHQFKLAALKAKQEGAIETAKLYLRQANGLKPMIEASANGLPVDVASIPKPPPGMGHDTDDYDVVQYEEAGALPGTTTKTRTEAFSQLEKDLVDQVAMCVRNVAHFKKAGDIPMAEKFERFNQHARKDLDSLRNAFRNSAPVPRFHYETRAFSVVKCCPELSDTVMELSVIRGMGYTMAGWSPSDFVTYVKWDFPFPAEAPQSGKTMAFKGTNEPEYTTSFTIQINRKSRSLARIFKAKGIKCEVYVKMGFLKADKVMGTVNISLETLETKCVHHTCIDLMEGKKAVGGKLEVRVRVREPLLKQQVEELREKWLVIDQFSK